jgi:hypothetical protein
LEILFSSFSRFPSFNHFCNFRSNKLDINFSNFFCRWKTNWKTKTDINSYFRAAPHWPKIGKNELDWIGYFFLIQFETLKIKVRKVAIISELLQTWERRFLFFLFVERVYPEANLGDWGRTGISCSRAFRLFVQWSLYKTVCSHRLLQVHLLKRKLILYGQYKSF